MLKALMLKRQIDSKKAELAALLEKDAGFQTREAELEAAGADYILPAIPDLEELLLE